MTRGWRRDDVPHDVFISYASEDEAPADAVRRALEAAGVRCWIARRDIMPGASWPAAIVRAIGESRAMLLVFSAHSNNSEQTKREVAQAVGGGIPILPVRIEALEPSGDMAYFLVTPHWLDAHSPPFEQHLRHLVATVKTILNRPRDPPAIPRPPTGTARTARGRYDPPGAERSPVRSLLLGLACLLCLGLGAWGAYELIQSRTGARQATARSNEAGEPSGAAPAGATTRGSDARATADGAGGAGTAVFSGNPSPAIPARPGERGPPLAATIPSPSPTTVAASATTNPEIVASTRPAAPAAEITITSPKPGTTVAAAVPLPPGQVVTARLDEPNSPGTRHYWRLDVPAGDYKLVWDVRAATGELTNLGGAVTLLTPEGEDLDRVIFISDVGYRWRAIGTYQPRLPARVILRVEAPRAEDYWLGVFPAAQPVPAPYFANRPPVEALAEGKSATVLLDGRSEKSQAAWYSLDLPPGDYKVTATFTLPAGRPSNVVGYVDVFDADGVERQGSLIFDSVVEIEFRRSAKLSIAAGAKPILRVRAGGVREYATVTVTKWAAE